MAHAAAAASASEESSALTATWESDTSETRPRS
jgi:hypothetical protein